VTGLSQLGLIALASPGGDGAANPRHLTDNPVNRPIGVSGRPADQQPRFEHCCVGGWVAGEQFLHLRHRQFAHPALSEYTVVSGGSSSSSRLSPSKPTKPRSSGMLRFGRRAAWYAPSATTSLNANTAVMSAGSIAVHGSPAGLGSGA
jgi:hypothetical protein